jgi:hypothetical protein
MKPIFRTCSLLSGVVLLLAQTTTSSPLDIVPDVDPNYTWSDKRPCHVKISLQQVCNSGTVTTSVNFDMRDANGQTIWGLEGPGLGKDKDKLKYHNVYDVDADGVGKINNTQGFNFRWKYYEGRFADPPQEWEKMTFTYVGEPAPPRDENNGDCTRNPWDVYDKKNVEWWQGCANGGQVPGERVSRE